MVASLPITLSGDNLGHRHRHLNKLVTEALEKGVKCQEIQDLPEATPVDRIFKIDFASKLRNVDYILQNIKDEDMLYVSKALKAKWLLEEEYQDIINPKYLEEHLYPYMITTAVSKFKNWLYLYLTNSQRCQEFYKFYSKNKFDYAIKFLGNCSVDFILAEVPAILVKLSPQHFKILCEKSPQVAKIYFENILTNDELIIKFLDNEQKFYNSLKVVLKLDAEIFFEITEKYFEHKYSRSLSKYIITNHKNRFDKKPELYAGMLLDMPTLAKRLTLEECKELVLKLARASYISHLINYKFVEPLIKKLPPDERAAFKKLVFVDKAFGEAVETWPYEKPSLPTRQNYNHHVFEDREYPHYSYHFRIKKRVIKKKCGKRGEIYVIESSKSRTLLDELFDEYRFYSFERTLFEVRRRIKQESSSQNRQYMLLVLVSKSGGKPALVEQLLQLLKQHSNEPINVKATVVRSLVKRAAVWRLPQHSWDDLLEFARGLGLDCNTPEADCREGLHAVVIRSLLEKGTCEPKIRNAFLKEYSHLDEYPTNSYERKTIRNKLPELLLAANDAETSPQSQAELLILLYDMLQKYKMNIESSPLIPAVVALEKRDSSVAEGLLHRLFNAKIARRTFFKENFQLIKTNASYLNALRHDTSILNVSTFVELIDKNEIRPEQFLRKLAIYFAESSGMMEQYLSEMKKHIVTEPSVGKSIARPLCLLQGSNLAYLDSLDVTNKVIARLAAAIRANMHVGRLKVEINAKILPTIGAKAVANKVLVCPAVKVQGYIKDLMTWKRTVRVAVVLAERTGQEADAFAAAAALRPTATLKAFLKYFRRSVDLDTSVYEVFHKLMSGFDISSEKYLHLRKYMINLEKIPLRIKADYSILLYNNLLKDNYHDAMCILSSMETFLSDVNGDFLEIIILDFLQKFDYVAYDRFNPAMNMHFRIMVKFLMLCKSEEVQKKRLTTICEPFIEFLTTFVTKLSTNLSDIFEMLLLLLQYNKVCFDETYVSPLPVMEKIISWMRQHLPVELNFNIYVRIHLTMLYFKSIRHSIKSNPDILNNEKRRLSEGISAVGRIFGRKIAEEIKQLTASYFESAIELYRNGIESYFADYFLYDVTKYQFIKAVVQGMVDGSRGEEVRAALYLLQEMRGNFQPDDAKELFEIMRNVGDEKFKYYLYAAIDNII